MDNFWHKSCDLASRLSEWRVAVVVDDFRCDGLDVFEKQKSGNLQQISYIHELPIVHAFCFRVSLLLFRLMFKMTLCIFCSRDN